MTEPEHQAPNDRPVERQRQAFPISSWRFWTGFGLVLAIVVGREILVRSGVVYGSENLRLLTIVAVGLVVLSAAMAFGSLTGLVATVGAVAALIALFQLTLPYTPEVPTAGACPGAQTQNVDFLATTHTSGINARAGPGRTYEFVGRFQGDCSLGFVGYCLGEPVIDVFYIPDFYVPDMRWLVLPENRGYVAAAVVRAQQPESDLTLVDGCPDAVELPDSIAVSGTASKGKEALRLSAAAEWASTVGFAAYYENEGPVFVRLGLDASASDGFLAEWDPTAALSDSEEALVVGVICYAAEIPSHIHDAVRVTASNGSKSVTEGTKQWESLPALTKDRAARKACLLPEA